MIQVFQEREKPRKVSFMDRLGKAAGIAATEIPAFLMKEQQEKEKKERIQRENETIKKLTGRDIAGIQDEHIRQKIVELTLKHDVESQKTADELIGNKKMLENLEDQRGLPRGSLAPYAKDVRLAETVSRPPKEPKKTQASQPIDPEQRKIINQVRSDPAFKEMDELEQYQALTDAGVSKENAQVEADLRGKQLTRKGTEIEKAYTAQKDFIEDTTNKYKAFETETKPRLLQMQNLKDDDIIGPSAAVFLEHLGIPLGALEDPSSELYQKLSLDLLKGLPETYGNRILKVEVDNFLKTIPSLMNSPDGRRMIASNILKLGEMKEVYYNEMRRQQLKYDEESKSLPRDFQQRIFDQVKPQIDKINNEFVKLSEITAVPKNHVPFFSPNGQVEFVPMEHVEWAQQNGGKRIW